VSTEVAQDALRPPQSLPRVQEQTDTIATKKPRREDGGVESYGQDETRPKRAALGLTVEESVAAKPIPIRASLVTPAPLPPLAPPVRDEIVEVSIGAIHVRVDAPPAQTIARPALTPAASPRDAAAARPARSALSRRALRRI